MCAAAAAPEEAWRLLRRLRTRTLRRNTSKKLRTNEDDEDGEDGEYVDEEDEQDAAVPAPADNKRKQVDRLTPRQLRHARRLREPYAGREVPQSAIACLAGELRMDVPRLQRWFTAAAAAGRLRGGCGVYIDTKTEPRPPARAYARPPKRARPTAEVSRPCCPHDV